MKRIICMLGLFVLLSACEKKAEDPAAAATNGAAAVTAPEVVTADIPADLEAEAAQEVTAENVDRVAAELEKEIEADTP